jgi:D-methionine transport system substrate-binding protein
MKKLSTAILVAALVFGLSQAVFAAGSKDSDSKAKVTLTIGATPVPHAELLDLIAADLAGEGITLKIVEYNDYVQPNNAVIAGDLDANFFQHIPYLLENPDWAAKLVSAFGVHVEPLGLYSSSAKSVATIKDGATIAIPNDPTNGGRALLLLQANDLLKLKADAGLTATPLDIAENPHNFTFKELEAAQLPRSLGDVDAAVITGNYALDAGLVPAKDALILEGKESPYVNIVVVKKGNENNANIAALKKALLSQKVKDYITQKWNGSVVAVF